MELNPKQQKRVKKLTTFEEDKDLAAQSELMDVNDTLEAIKENTENLKNKPEVTKVEITNDTNDLAKAFYAMLRGPKGETGEKGESVQGEKGDTGEKGIDGAKGEKGDKGDQGERGLDGLNGLDGRDGANGKDGKDGKDGSPDTAEELKDKLESLDEESAFDIKRTKGYKAIEQAIQLLMNRPGGGGNIEVYSSNNKVGSGQRINFDGSGVSTSYDGGMVTITIAGGGGNMVDDEVPTGLINGSNTAYTLSQTPSPAASLKVYQNGTKRTLTTDYTLSGSTLTFVVAPESGDIITVDYRYA